VLVACNTASAHALPTLTAELTVPVLGAVEPGAGEAVDATRCGVIGVIATLGAIRSGSYPRAIERLWAGRVPAVKIAQLACPLLVPLVEEGWLGDGEERESRAAQAIAERYLGQLHELAPDLDVLVLGCTHYPVLKPLLARVADRIFGHPVTLVDSAGAMALAAERALEEAGLLSGSGEGSLRCFVTDDARFGEVASRFLGRPVGRSRRSIFDPGCDPGSERSGRPRSAWLASPVARSRAGS